MKKFLTIAILALLSECALFAAPKTVTIKPSEPAKEVVDTTVTATDSIDDTTLAKNQAAYDFEKEQLELEHRKQVSKSENAIALISVICGTFLPFTAICVIIWLVFYYNSKKRKEKYRLIEKAIEKGVNIPESVFNEGKTKGKNESKPIAQIRKAIVLISVGIAGIIFFIFCNSAEMAGLVSMVALIGIGNLIVGILEYRKQQGKAEQEETIENDATKD